MRHLFLASVLLVAVALPADAQSRKQQANQKTTEKPQHLQSDTYQALQFRSVGPAVTSGRISDFAVHPQSPDLYYVASSSGGVWKTENRGTTYEPLFDGQGSYSIGCVSLDPSNPSTVWVGTGENNNQRSVGYGDGVYKSLDGGKSWQNMGLKNSEHIANILVDPTNSNIIWVAAYGPLWSNGGERGVYKSTDGGQSWKLMKEVSPYTGCNNLVMDPRDPNTLYAAFHQRQRSVFTYIGGGPESALFKTTDGGQSWKKLEGGLPGGDVGRIGIDVSPANPDVVYAVVEAPEDKGGIYRSADRGASWKRQSGTFTSGNYYQELTCDPVNPDRIFITDVWYKVSDDGGITVRNLGELNKHIDNHAIWINPKNTNHLLVGSDGGIYETWDFAKTWHFKPNLPVVQFYKVATDNAEPFYHIHGGTQDNLSLGGPSRTTSGNGIVNADWYITSIGDGFESQVDPTDPNIIYAQSQHGGLVRFDRRSGEYLYIKPMEGEGEEPLRWNWDSPLLISQHQPKRLYIGASRVYRTDDQGSSWRAISPDLSRGIDRNRLPMMGRIWSVDAIAKNGSTDIYGQTTTIAESGLDERLLWVGTDDGLLHLTRDGGQNWQKIDNIAGAPRQSYVNQVIASLHDKNVAYVAFNHHRYGDFKPYLFKTSDGGKSWRPLHASLPQRGSVYTIAEDHVDPNLLFCGTEFGVFFSQDGGSNWVPLKSGLPTIAVRDIEIQRRENDLVLGTFGRGFYVLDDYSPLRTLNEQSFAQAAAILPIKDSWLFVERYPLGLRDKGHLGSSYFAAANPPVGPVFTYYLREEPKTLRSRRRELEKAALDRNESIYYPSLDSLRLEGDQPEPYLLFTITDGEGNVVRHLKAPAKKGLQRIVWDFRHNVPAPVTNRTVPAPDELFGSAPKGQLAIPGEYRVSLSKYEDGVLSPLTEEKRFRVKALGEATFQAQDWQAYKEFTENISRMTKAVSAATNIQKELFANLTHMQNAVMDMPAPPAEALKEIYQLQRRLLQVKLLLTGDDVRARLQFETPPSIADRVGTLQYGMWTSTATPPQAYRESYAIAARQFGPVLRQLREIADQADALQKKLELSGAPYTPGRWPEWTEQ
ncbi:VPS10 domain-containing protein [Cesiribacter andamanensis]|uniref:Ycf48-like protein n=1 Tax=Cesiribacter andamanensis AMV16 TaxID=1279009 RepID=M7N9C7_9BACT|nr:photosynthesis system II assembly factor Ycf48 [Cesiribacter andamanensis]EMR03862.1 Ycf48-like protein [Cesiribacter andamanensis AMV16]